MPPTVRHASRHCKSGTSNLQNQEVIDKSQIVPGTELASQQHLFQCSESRCLQYAHPSTDLFFPRTTDGTIQNEQQDHQRTLNQGTRFFVYYLGKATAGAQHPELLYRCGSFSERN